MATTQQRLRKWYRSDSLLWRAVAIGIKAALELGVFAAVATGITAVFYPLVRVDVLIPAGDMGLSVIWTAIVGLLLRQEWCFTTRSISDSTDAAQ